MKLDRDAVARAHGWPSWARVIEDSRRDGYTENGGRGPAAVAISRIAAHAEKLIELVDAYDEQERPPPPAQQLKPQPLSADEEAEMRRHFGGIQDFERLLATLDAARANAAPAEGWGIWDDHRKQWVTREMEMVFSSETDAQVTADSFDTKDGRRYYEARRMPRRCPGCGAAPCTLATAQCVVSEADMEIP